ncbi:MAG: ADP-ribosylation/crystallin J1 [Chloroflexota bacterium]
MILYRPVGLKELQLIAESGYKAFPPRLPYQPIFYPVLTYSYAEQIARDWNTDDEASGYAGFVTQFDVDDEYVARYEIKTVGGSVHQELWVPAERLGEFNAHLRGRITVQASFYGAKFGGQVDPGTNLPASISQIPNALA